MVQLSCIQRKIEVRGSKGSKVLRTRKIKNTQTDDYYDVNSIYNYFCSQHCKTTFANKHANANHKDSATTRATRNTYS